MIHLADSFQQINRIDSAEQTCYIGAVRTHPWGSFQLELETSSQSQLLDSRKSILLLPRSMLSVSPRMFHFLGNVMIILELHYILLYVWKFYLLPEWNNLKLQIGDPYFNFWTYFYQLRTWGERGIWRAESTLTLNTSSDFKDWKKNIQSELFFFPSPERSGVIDEGLY